MESIRPEDMEALPAPVKEALEAAKAKFGDKVVVLHSDESDITVVCRRPSGAIYRKWRDERSDPTRRAACIENLFYACLLHPEPKDFRTKIAEDFPALPDSFGGELLDTGVGAEDVSAKKA
jgi:hypothetical protein